MSVVMVASRLELTIFENQKKYFQGEKDLEREEEDFADQKTNLKTQNFGGNSKIGRGRKRKK